MNFVLYKQLKRTMLEVKNALILTGLVKEKEVEEKFGENFFNFMVDRYTTSSTKKTLITDLGNISKIKQPKINSEQEVFQRKVRALKRKRRSRPGEQVTVNDMIELCDKFFGVKKNSVLKCPFPFFAQDTDKKLVLFGTSKEDMLSEDSLSFSYRLTDGTATVLLPTMRYIRIIDKDKSLKEIHYGFPENLNNDHSFLVDGEELPLLEDFVFNFLPAWTYLRFVLKDNGKDVQASKSPSQYSKQDKILGKALIEGVKVVDEELFGIRVIQQLDNLTSLPNSGKYNSFYSALSAGLIATGDNPRSVQTLRTSLSTDLSSKLTKYVEDTSLGLSSFADGQKEYGLDYFRSVFSLQVGTDNQVAYIADEVFQDTEKVKKVSTDVMKKIVAVLAWEAKNVGPANWQIVYLVPNMFNTRLIVYKEDIRSDEDTFYSTPLELCPNRVDDSTSNIYMKYITTNGMDPRFEWLFYNKLPPGDEVFHLLKIENQRIKSVLWDDIDQIEIKDRLSDRDRKEQLLEQLKSDREETIRNHERKELDAERAKQHARAVRERTETARRAEKLQVERKRKHEKELKRERIALEQAAVRLEQDKIERAHARAHARAREYSVMLKAKLKEMRKTKGPEPPVVWPARAKQGQVDTTTLPLALGVPGNYSAFRSDAPTKQSNYPADVPMSFGLQFPRMIPATVYARTATYYARTALPVTNMISFKVPFPEALLVLNETRSVDIQKELNGSLSLDSRDAPWLLCGTLFFAHPHIARFLLSNFFRTDGPLMDITETLAVQQLQRDAANRDQSDCVRAFVTISVATYLLVINKQLVRDSSRDTLFTLAEQAMSHVQNVTLRIDQQSFGSGTGHGRIDTDGTRLYIHPNAGEHLDNQLVTLFNRL
jgi:hypothetical protein